MKLSHREWSEQKERELEDKKYEELLKKRKEDMQQQARRRKSQAEFDNWLLHKDSYERAVTLLGQLSELRKQEKDEWKEVAISLNAVDMLRGVDSSSDDTKKSLADVFYKWSKDGFEFDNIPVSTELAKTFSLNAQEIMGEYAEQMDRPGEYVIPSLKYTMPRAKQAATDKRNLNNPDTKIYNRIYMKLLRGEYAKANDEMRKRFEELLSKFEDVSQPKAEKRALSIMGLNKLAKWVEEDAINKEEMERRRKEADREQNKKVHQGFVAKKDRMRIRLPDNEQEEVVDELEARRKSVLLGKKENKASNMSFSRGGTKSLRASKSSSHRSSVEMLAGKTPQKYVYATNHDDLENSRKALAKKGFVFKENFKDIDGDFLNDEYEDAVAQRKHSTRKDPVEERKKKAAESYEQWRIQKDIRLRAIDALKYIAKPATLGDPKPKKEEHWQFVGEQLKSIDQSLLRYWTEWSDGFKTPGQCKVKWDSLPPKQCDTCCSSSSVHAALLKLLNRPGVNFVEIFDFAVNRKLRENLASDDRDLSEATEEERKQVEDSLQLDTRKFRKMMLDAGIKLQDVEARMLTTLFDEDGDGLISRKEFLRFSGYEPRPGVRGDALQWLRGGEFCCWESCCHVTGLSSAYEVVPCDEGQENKASRAGSDGEDNYDTEEGFESEVPNSSLTPTAKPLPLRLSSGKIKRGWKRLPLPDLEKRIKKLVKMGDRTATDFLKEPPRSCEFAVWSNDQRLTALEGLETLAERFVPIEAPESAPPLAPLFTADVSEDTITLQWTPAKESPFVAFYVVETAGREGGKRHRSHEFKLLIRDPPKLTPDAKLQTKFVWKDRKPGTRYFFRIRAYNNFGASPFSHASFLTAPSQPFVPVVKGISSNSVTISWGGVGSAVKTISRDLRDTFLSLDTKSTGSVDRETLLELLESRYPQQLKSLEKLPSATIPSSSVLDMLEAYGVDSISWQQIHDWIEQASAAMDSSAQIATEEDATKNGAQRKFQYTLCKCVSDEFVNSRGEGSLGGGKTSMDIANSVLKASKWFSRTSNGGEQLDLPKLHVVEFPVSSSKANEKPSLKIVVSKPKQDKNAQTQIVGKLSEPVSHLEVFEQCYVGFDTTATVTGLEKGLTYQFRLTMLNAEQGIASRMSQAIIVTIPDGGPERPRVRPGSVTTDSVYLLWGAEKQERRETGKDWQKVVGEWVKDPRENNHGVNMATAQKMFMRYDRDGNKTLDAPELIELFKDLGLPTKGPAFVDAIANLDSNGDGKVSFEEFYQWWSTKEEKYLLLHKSSVDGKFKIVYRGEKQWAKLTGLEPNALQTFVLQVDQKKSLSVKSKELSFWTAPETPQQPVVIETGPRHCFLKWYSGVKGADRYVVEVTLVENLGRRVSSRGIQPGGTKVQNATTEIIVSKSLVKIPGLSPQSVYRVRVRALNKDGLSSSSSLPTQFETQSSEYNSERIMSEANAPNYFVIECAGDIVSGDVVLFTERVFKQENRQDEALRSRTNNARTPRSKLITRNGLQRPQTAGSLTSSRTLSQQSISTMTKEEQGKEFVAERTVAARCQGVINTRKGFQFNFHVIWSSLSIKDSPQEYLLRPGLPISRLDADIFKFETFRASWVQEQGRWSFDEEQEHFHEIQLGGSRENE